ncbi:16332_t:CDS:10, partial [Acaulospora colombiana]
MKNSLVSEIRHSVDEYGLKGRKVDSVYFGGGTPSLALPSTFDAILRTISQYCYLPIDAEITMESTESKKLVEFRSIGINRLSLGLQSLYPKDLKLLGRDHSVEEGVKSLEMAKLMALKLASNHVSLYELTIKSGTPIYRDYKLGRYTTPTTDTMAGMYEATVQVAKDFGFNQYEVSSFERKEKFSKHNFGYWRGSDYLGIGPGAHGRIYNPSTATRTRTYNVCKDRDHQILYPEEWMAQCEELGHG